MVEPEIFSIFFEFFEFYSINIQLLLLLLRQRRAQRNRTAVINRSLHNEILLNLGLRILVFENSVVEGFGH